MIRRSILRVLLCPPIHLAGLVYFPMPFCLNGIGVRAGFLAGMPLCRGHEVANQPRHTLGMWVSVLPPPVGVATCTLGNSWRAVRVYIPWPPGLQSICQLANLDQLEVLLFDGILWHDEFVVVEACLVFGGRHVIIILLLSICRSLRRAGLSILLS